VTVWAMRQGTKQEPNAGELLMGLRSTRARMKIQFLLTRGRLGGELSDGSISEQTQTGNRGGLMVRCSYRERHGT
jgi:hypothetical protein